MTTEASPKLYAGRDLQANNTFCAVINHTGQPIFQQRRPNELPTICQALQPFQPQLQAVAVQSTFNWHWLVDGLQAASFPVQLANPAKIQQYRGLKRTGDSSDALRLAEMLRLGIVPTGYIYPKAQPLFCLLREPARVGRSEPRRASQRVEKPNPWTRDGTAAFLVPTGGGMGHGADGAITPLSSTSWVTEQNRNEQARRGRESSVRRAVNPSRQGRVVKASVRELFVLIGTFYG